MNLDSKLDPKKHSKFFKYGHLIILKNVIQLSKSDSSLGSNEKFRV